MAEPLRGDPAGVPRTRGKTLGGMLPRPIQAAVRVPLPRGPFTGVRGGHAAHASADDPTWSEPPCSGATTRPPPGPTAVDTVENSMCSRRPVRKKSPLATVGRMAECLSMEWRPIDLAKATVMLCWPWSPPRAIVVHGSLSDPVVWRSGEVVGSSLAPSVVPRWLLKVTSMLPTGAGGSARGPGYHGARGEILRPLRDQPQRRRSAGACPSTKDESLGSKDDQTPS